jgi:hypothetical protein
MAAPAASSVSVRAADRLASTPSPSDPPIMNAVLTTPEARPESLGSTSLIATSTVSDPCIVAFPVGRASYFFLARSFSISRKCSIDSLGPKSSSSKNCRTSISAAPPSMEGLG